MAEKETYTKEEIPQLVVNILNQLNDDQEIIDSDSDLLQYIKNYINL